MSSDPVLVELAREDARLFQLRQQVAALPKRITGLDDEKKRAQRQLEECEAVYQKQEKARRKLENEKSSDPTPIMGRGRSTAKGSPSVAASWIAGPPG